MSHKELRDRTQREMALAGNHWDAIGKHLDAYEAAYAHELAEKIRSQDPVEAALAGQDAWRIAADLIDPEVSNDG